MMEKNHNLIGLESSVSEAGCKWPGLDAVRKTLQTQNYSIVEEPGELVARKVCWMGLGDRRELFFIFRSFPTITEQELIDYQDECESYAKLNQRWHAYSGYIVFAVAICEKADKDAISFAVNYHPSKDPSTAHAPLVVDRGRNQVYYLQEVPKFWAVYIYGEMRQKIKDYLCA